MFTRLASLIVVLGMLFTFSACDQKTFSEDASDYDPTDAKYKLDAQGRSTVAVKKIKERYEAEFDPAWGRPTKSVEHEDIVDDFGVDYRIDRTIVRYVFTTISPEDYVSLGQTTECTGEKKMRDCVLVSGRLVESTDTTQAFSFQETDANGTVRTEFSYDYDPRYEG